MCSPCPSDLAITPPCVPVMFNKINIYIYIFASKSRNGEGQSLSRWLQFLHGRAARCAVCCAVCHVGQLRWSPPAPSLPKPAVSWRTSSPPRDTSGCQPGSRASVLLCSIRSKAVSISLFETARLEAGEGAHATRASRACHKL